MTTVLFLHPSSEISGGERSLLALWASLDRSRFRPLIVLPGKGPLVDEARAAGVPVFLRTLPSWRSADIGGLGAAFCALRGILHSEGVRIIHSYSPRYNLMGILAGRPLGCRVIWHERNIPVAGEADVSRIFFGWPDALICNSRAVARRFPLHPRVEVIHNGVDTAHFFPCAVTGAERRGLGLPDGLIVGVVANWAARKGLEIFLAAAAQVAARMTGVSFLVVGGAYGQGGSARAAVLRARAAGLGLEGRILWAGFQPDTAPYLRAMDVLCHPTAGEACSRAVLEAMACGRPVVAFNDGGNPEIVENGVSGCLVSSGNTGALAGAVIELLQDPASRDRIGLFARQRVEATFTCGRNAAATMGLYDRLL